MKERRRREVARLTGEASALLHRGHFAEAVQVFEEALPAARDVGKQEEALVVNGLALAHAGLGLTDQAYRELERATALARETNDRGLEGAVLNAMGELLRGQGRSREARAWYEAALAAARAGGVRAGEGAVLNNLGLVCADLGEVADAERYFAEALHVRQEVGDRAGEGQTLHNWGVLRQQVGELDGAEQLLGQALEITEGLGDLFGVSHILDAWGVLQSYRGRLRDALQAHEASLDIARQLGARRLEATSLRNVAKVFKELGRADEARERLAEAFVISRQLGDRRGELRHFIDLGGLERVHGRIDAAEELTRAALNVAREIGSTRAEGSALRELGIIARDRGRPDEALVHLTEALAVSRETGDLRLEADAHTSLGILQGSVGRFEQAIRHHRDALSFRERADVLRTPESLHNLGMAYRDAERWEDALATYRRALALEQRLGDVRGEGGTLRAIGEIESLIGRPAQAVEEYRSALERHRVTGDRATEAATLAGLGDALLMLGRPADAVTEYEAAVKVAHEVGDRNREVSLQAALGAAHESVGLPDMALAYVEKAISGLEELRGGVLSEDIKTSFFSNAYGVFSLYVHLLVHSGDVERAVHAVGRGKARTFVDLLGESHADVREGIDPDLREKERRLTEEIRATRQQIVAIQSREPVDGDDVVLADLARREAELDQALELNEVAIKKSGRYADLTKPEIWDVERIRRELLDSETVVLEYMLADDQSYVFVVSSDALEVFELPPKRKLEAEVRELRTAIVARLHRYPHGHALYQQLLGPAAELIQGKDLLICPDGALHYLPFALLLTRSPDDVLDQPAEERMLGERELVQALIARLASLPPFDWRGLPYLIREHPIRSASSATVAGIIHQRGLGGERHYDVQFAALADPMALPVPHTRGGDEEGAVTPVELAAALVHTGDSLAPVPMTAVEAWALAELVSGGALPANRASPFDDGRIAVYTGVDATKGEVQKLTSGKRSLRFFHLASHSLLDPEKPQFSGVVFTPEDDPFWHTFEIFNARIPSALVVLSACETGMGRVVSGEGMVGLTRAFLYAGAESVCVSLWRVADVSSPPLMAAFYTGLLAENGKSRAQALQQAQLCFLEKDLMRDFYACRLGELHELRGAELPAPGDERYRHPFYWAPFVLVGEAGGMSPPTPELSNP